jgi:hypothetical protein
MVDLAALVRAASRMNRSRRVFLATGVLGAAALATAGWLRVRAPADAVGRGLDADASAIVRALVPAFLAGALPTETSARKDAIDATLASVDAAIVGLPPHAQRELAQLFALLSFAPARLALAGLSSDWRDASETQVDAVLERWRTSRATLLRSAYEGLHQLLIAAWYGNPRAWEAIGYAGPPALG